MKKVPDSNWYLVSKLYKEVFSFSQVMTMIIIITPVHTGDRTYSGIIEWNERKIHREKYEAS